MQKVAVHQIKLPMSNAYLVTGKQPVLVDTGGAKDASRILRALQQHGVEPKSLAAILLTHAHGDHAGSCAELRAITGAPIMMGVKEKDRAASGRNGILKPTRFTAKFVQPFVDRPFPAFEADVLLTVNQTLDEFGIDLGVLETPGHTAGSISFLTLDGSAIAGDILMGGVMGGAFLAHKPNLHYFAEELGTNMISLTKLLKAGVNTFYVGHGGPLTKDAIKSWL